MKRIFFFVFILSYFVTTSEGQTFTEAFDQVFANINKRDATTGILYERVLPFANLTKFDSRILPPDTSSCYHYLQSYSEMYRACFVNQSNMLHFDSLKKLIINDTSFVNIGLLHFEFDIFDSTVFYQKLFFNADTVLLEDTTNANVLYKKNEMFVASPLREKVSTQTIQYMVGNQFCFDNTRNQIKDLYIDFDDGLSYRYIIRGRAITITYVLPGEKNIRFLAILENGDTLDAVAKILVLENQREESQSIYPYTDDYTGTTAIQARISLPNPYEEGVFSKLKGEVRIYYAHSDKILRKPLLIIDGFDPQDERKFEQCVTEGKKSLWDMLFYDDSFGQHLHLGLSLLNMGYDVVLLNFPDGGAYIEQNAMVCIEVINRLNEMLLQNNSDEQLIVVGPSMGGQIARYALTYMEQNPTEFTNEGNHNTRLWISYDSPHQGANISLGAQSLIEYFAKENGTNNISKIWNNTLCCNAALQMLIHHKKDTLQQKYNLYYNNLRNLNIQTNGYPSNVRKISVANGSINNILTGIGSQICFTSSTPLLFSELWIQIKKMSDASMEELFSITVPIFGMPIKFAKYNYYNNSGKCGLDDAPGCLFDTFDQIETALNNMPLVGFISFIIVNSHNHCFMPITSTLDISGNMNYCTDISSRDLVAEGLTPFDSYAGAMDSNMYHVTFNQQLVDYLLNEIETYISGQREIQLCTRPSYTMHLPQNTTATVTWYASDNIQIVPTNNPNVVNVIPLYEGDAWICADVSTLGHKKNLAHYPIHISNNTSFTPTVFGTTIQGQSMLIDGTMYLSSDTFCVENGKTLTVTGTLYCAAGTRLIVRPGGTLIVDGGTLTSACADEMWQGIEVAGDRTKHQTATNQGTVILQNGASIENAHCAIRTGLEGNEWLTAGGIVQCSNSTFRNNRRAVSFYSYVDTISPGFYGDNKSWFKDCTFTLDNDNLFLSQNMEFLNHVTLWDVKGVSFEGCTFENLTTGYYPDRKHGIYAENAGFSVRTLCNTLDGCNCYGTADTNRFTGFSTAVEACNAGSPFAVTIDEAKFENNATGVFVQASNYATVTRCVFDLSTNPLNGRNVAGLLLSNTIGYHVEGNAFTATPNNAPLSRWGVHVNKSMKLNNSLYRNSFRNLNRGISVTDTNGLGRNGLCFSCNTFEDCAYGIYVSTNGIVASMQGNISKGVDNSFTGTQTSSLYNLGPTQINYYHSSNTGFILHLPTGVYTESDLATANPCNQTVCDQGGNVNPIDNFAGVDMTADVAGNSGQGNVDNAAVQMATSNYYAAVRGIMRDSVENLQTLAAWHSAAGIYADPYSLTEVATALGTADVSNISSAQLSQPELDNFIAFRTLAATLRPNANNPAVNWPAATPAQVVELQRIAEANTGRSSAMAKGVLCFFFDICYEEDETKGLLVETFHGTSPQNGTDGGLLVYPNPTDGTIYVELSAADIQYITIFNLQGEVMKYISTPQGKNSFISIKDLPSGIYMIRVTGSNGHIYHHKLIKR